MKGWWKEERKTGRRKVTGQDNGRVLGWKTVLGGR